MAVLGGTVKCFSWNFQRAINGKPGGCTTRLNKTKARRWPLEEIDQWLRYHLEPEAFDFGWNDANLPGPEVRYVLAERSGL